MVHEASFEEKMTYILIKCAKDAGFGRWEGKDSIPMSEFEEALEKFSNNLIERLKKEFAPME